MNIKQILEKITRNWGAKIICFIMAVFIYFFHQTADLERKSLIVPLTVIDNGNFTAIEGLGNIRNVKITVRVKSELASSISENELKASIDFSSITKEGFYNIPVFVEPSSRIQLMEPLEISVKPDFIRIKAEEKVTAAIEYKPVVSGKPAYGYKAVHVKVEPAFAQVSGPKSVVQSTNYIYLNSINIDQAQENLVKYAKPANLSKYLNIEEKSAKVHVGIVPEGMVKEFKFHKINLLNVDENLEVVDFNQTVNLTVEGDMLEIEKLSKDDVFVAADLDGISDEGKYELNLSFSLPKNLEVVNSSIKSIVVELKKKELVPQEVTEEKSETELIEAEEKENSEDNELEIENVIEELPAGEIS